MVSRTATTAVTARAYTSPTLVLLAMNWDDGAQRDDFLGFAILRAPGFTPGEADGYLVNKIGFTPPQPGSQPLPSNLAPIQKFLWWDSAISEQDRGKTFTYTVTPVCGTGAQDLKLQSDAATTLSVSVPPVTRDGISTWFNRAVVASQAFSREFPNPQADLDRCMAWLANGMGDAFAAITHGATDMAGAIYHLTDQEWVMPALTSVPGTLDLVYEARSNDHTDDPAIAILKKRPHVVAHPRTKTAIMHDKFLIDQHNSRVLAGSANFTPEGLTAQANLLHIFDSAPLANLYLARQRLIAPDPSVGDTAKHTGWSAPVAVGPAHIRVFFSPEPAKARTSLDTVVAAIKAAQSSVIFCLYSPTDAALISALLAAGDHGHLMYGLLNSISDPNAKQDDLSSSGEAPKSPGPNTSIQVTLYNRSRKDKKVIAYDYFRKGATPAGFLPELNSIDLSARSTLPPAKAGANAGAKAKRPPPAVHIHHKFIVIDADTANPVIYTGSANLSKNSTNHNDENLLEIKGSPELAQTYFAEFMRLYEHYRARALWDWAQGGSAKGRTAKAQTKKTSATFTLKTTRDGWVRDAYRKGTPEFVARTVLSKPLK